MLPSLVLLYLKLYFHIKMTMTNSSYADDFR